MLSNVDLSFVSDSLQVLFFAGLETFVYLYSFRGCSHITVEFALVFRSRCKPAVHMSIRFIYADKSLACFSTAVPERPYYDNDYYPLCNTHFCRLLLCSISDCRVGIARQLRIRCAMHTLHLSLSARNTGFCVSPYKNWRFELDRKKVQSKKLFNFQF
jgi:hypothetical protein